MNIDQYIADHIDPEPPQLRSLYRRTHIERLYPRMCTDHVQGRLLVMLTRMIRPHRILELGTFSGYSTLCFAEGMPPGCTIDTVEVDTEHADEIRAEFDRSPRGADIRLHIGDAENLITSLADEGEPFDMVFADADKRAYPRYYELLMGILAPEHTSWPTTRFGTTKYSAKTPTTRRQPAYGHSTTSLPTTTAWKK